MIARHTNLLFAAADNVARSPRGYAVAALGLVLGLGLLLAGVAVGEGLKTEALAAVDAGADVYCAWDTFGRDTPVAQERVAELAAIDGVERALPRIVGRLPFADDYAIVVGVPLAAVSDYGGAAIPVLGSLPQDPGEVLVGAELAREADLVPGRTIALEGDSVRLFRVAGVIDGNSSLWSAKAIVGELAEMAIVFGEKERVSDVCLYTRPGYATLVAETVLRLDRRYRIQTKALVRGYVQRGMTLREGVFTVLFALALALAIPSFAVLTYMGTAPRRRTIGLLKTEGWSTADVLEMVVFENAIVSLIAASAALLLAFVWVTVLRAPLVAPFFLPELPLFPAMEIPARFTPLPPLLALVFSLTVTMTGSIVATWRTAATRPAEVLR